MSQSINIDNYWSDINENKLTHKFSNRQIIPEQYRTLHLDLPILQKTLLKAPLWMTESITGTLIKVPYPDGSLHTFEVLYAPVMHPELAAKFPSIRSYTGIGVDDPDTHIRFGVTSKGFHAMIRSSQHSTIFIDPYAKGDIEYYVSYYKKDYSRSKKNNKWECLVDEVNTAANKWEIADYSARTGDCQLRKYRLALACTAEYANFHINEENTDDDETDVMSAFATTMARVNGIFERDASITMELVPNTNQLIYYDAENDPYTNNSGTTMLGENQSTCDNVIGSANYDIGHVFSTGGGGVAYLRSPCNNALKAGGVTGQPSPINDPFDVDYVAHEIGHQYGANHTQNNNCNRAESYEPGSASTIMGYAGICTPNVQNNSDDHFHVHSLFEMAAFVGTSCGTILENNNSAPVASVAQNNYILPISTPFVLTGIGTDVDNDILTYCWEQYDKEVAPMPPQSTNKQGPAFRSISPTTAPERYFPNLDAIINNTAPMWEVLPSVSRDMNFQLTVRDNHPDSGCTDETQVSLTFTDTAGPFLVTTPNNNVTWEGGTPQTITWDVANTTTAPVNCANVDILLSLDGGLSYPITLASNVSNNGSHEIVISNVATNTARIKVQCSDNIFFDISDTNFTILESPPGYFLRPKPNELSVCVPDNAVYIIEVGAILDYDKPVTLSLENAPTNTQVEFSNNPILPGQSSTLTISDITNSGNYIMQLSATSMVGDKSTDLSLHVFNDVPTEVQLNSPANNALNVARSPEFSWTTNANATTYNLQIASDEAFTNIIETAADLTETSYQSTTHLSSNTVYFWQVIAQNVCGEGAINHRSFTTSNIECNTITNNNPVNISDSGTPSITSIINIPSTGALIDLEVLDIQGTHTWIEDLSFLIKSPNGEEALLLNRPCFNENDFFISFSDDETSLAHSDIPCPPTDGQTYQPNESFTSFKSQPITGDWVLQINDNANFDGGRLESWSLKYCAEARSLPLEWVDFAVKTKNSTIQLHWITAAEIENKGFEILRSRQAQQGFEKIAWVESKGKANQQQSYSFTDKSASPNVTYYYQLQQIDNNGQSNFSEVRSASWQNSMSRVDVYPNPVKNKLYIQLPTTIAPISFTLFDALGQKVFPTIDQLEDSNSISMNCQNLPQGIYFLKWEEAGNSQIISVIITK